MADVIWTTVKLASFTTLTKMTGSRSNTSTHRPGKMKQWSTLWQLQAIVPAQ